MNFIIKNARFLYTVDAKDSILENASIVVRNGAIESINPAQLPDDITEIFDAKNELVKIAYPGENI